jgi:hypothetical protein
MMMMMEVKSKHYLLLYQSQRPKIINPLHGTRV